MVKQYIRRDFTRMDNNNLNERGIPTVSPSGRKYANPYVLPEGFVPKKPIEDNKIIEQEKILNPGTPLAPGSPLAPGNPLDPGKFLENKSEENLNPPKKEIEKEEDILSKYLTKSTYIPEEDKDEKNSFISGTNITRPQSVQSPNMNGRIVRYDTQTGEPIVDRVVNPLINPSTNPSASPATSSLINPSASQVTQPTSQSSYISRPQAPATSPTSTQAGASYTGAPQVRSPYTGAPQARSPYTGAPQANSPYGMNRPVGTQQNPYDTGNMNAYGSNDYYGLNDYYNSPYYNKKKKMSDGKVIALALFAVAISVLLVVAIGGVAINLSVKNAREDAYKTELYLEDTYGITIYTGQDADLSEEGFEISSIENDASTSLALENIQSVFDRLPEGFIDELMEGYSKGRYLEIDITGTMTQDEGGRSIVGLTTYEQNKDIVRLDATVTASDEFKATVAHELFHVIEFEMNQFDEASSYLKEWKKHNPRDFAYSYDEGQYSDYTVYGESINNVYFVSLYSKEDIFEDRAELFSYLMSTDENDKLPKAYQSKYVKDKANMLINEISSHFSSAVSNPYWARWSE